MGRQPRIQESDLHYHVIVRCNNGALRFQSEKDFLLYLAVIRFFKKKHRFKLFNYALMGSHVHLFLQPSEKVSLQKTMHFVNWHYARAYNRRHNRKGHFWMDRYKSIPVESDKHALDLMRYINRNAVRAGLVSRPEEWRWGGYRFYALGEPDELLESHPTFLGLSSREEVRRRAFEEYVNMLVPGEDKRKPEFSDSRYIGSENFARHLGLSTDRY